MSDEQLPAYAIAHLRDVTFGAEIVRYMREIDATLTPFGGKFVVHGGPVDAVEGQWARRCHTAAGRVEELLRGEVV